MKKLIIAIVAVILIVIAWSFVFNKKSADVVVVPTDTTVATTTPVVVDKTKTVIGASVEGRDITAYHFGEGDKNVLFVGGIHGGYEWNTSLVAYQLMDYLKATPTAVPAGVRVTVIPVVNPDGLNKVTTATATFAPSSITASQETQVSGRFNAHTVDLNRNFDCDWQATGKWQSKTVSGGTAAFSEPESLAIKNYVETLKPSAVVVYYSAAGGVFSSNCHGEVLAETNTLTNLYAKASGYPAHQSFDFYEITGDMVNWLAKIKVPAISVLLTNHTDSQWAINQKGVDAVLAHYAQ